MLTAERVAKVMSDLLSRQFNAKITIILEDEDDTQKDELTEEKTPDERT